ncbi:MAG: hypothetical protein KKG99_02250 [Bacteroidetes bacterium]|nr:hypothetical protein [Bacteroidota bacterium]
MKTLKSILVIIVILLVTLTTQAQEKEFPKLTGPYLGQKPPDNKPIIFADGIVSSDTDHCSATFSTDGKEIYWEIGTKIGFTKLVNGIWSKPDILPFCKEDSYQYGNPFIAPDNNKMFFTTFRSGAVSEKKENIWYVQRISTGWSDPKPVSPDVNQIPLHWSISVSNSGTLFFQGTMDDSYGGAGDIYYSNLVNGVYTKPVNMGQEINTAGTETCPYIAPDESYIIFTRMGTSPENSGIFISYRDNSGKWLSAVILEGGSIERGGLSPKVTPDGKYLFYVNGGMFWMPIMERIEELRPKK